MLFFYRRLWLRAEADRRAAHADATVTREELFKIGEQMSALCDHIEDQVVDPEMRGLVRRLRHQVQHSHSVIGPRA